MYLLTIIIPTYNRADCLSLLLTSLTNELHGVEDKVSILIGDNASTDLTPSVTSAFLGKHPTAQLLRHPKNLGPDENFCSCIDNVISKYFWIFGDDDLPKPGVLRYIVQLLSSQKPDLVYLNSEWMKHITGPNDSEQVANLSAIRLTSEDFSRKVNVWVTFISGMIINLDRLYELNPGLSTRRFSGTSLVQLGWVLPLLMTGNRFYMIVQRCVLATSGNTGGYELFKVFGKNFPLILNDVCGENSNETKKIREILSWDFIPNLLWSSRFGGTQRFIEEDLLKSLVLFNKTIAYWAIFFPIIKFSKTLATPFFIFSKIYSLKFQAKDFFGRLTSY
jgi:abequosyltransferase